LSRELAANPVFEGGRTAEGQPVIRTGSEAMKIIRRQGWFRVPCALSPHWKRVLVPGVALCTCRFGSGMGRHLIAETIRFSLAAADREDPRYHPSQESGGRKRARHAILETFTSQTARGSRAPADSRFVAIYGASFIANSWYPDSRATPGYALRRGSTALGSSVGFNLFREFFPRKKLKASQVEP
jgi:hypothetical protein